MGLAGALQVKAWDGKDKVTAASILLFGERFGSAPYYGELPYTGRMIDKGFNHGMALRK